MDSSTMLIWARYAGFGLATLLFVVGLVLQRRVPTARNGNRLSAIGMLLAVLLTLTGSGTFDPAFIIAGMVIGAAVGLFAAYRVPMTAMPQMVAIFNGMGGGASMLVALSCFHHAAFSENAVLGTMAILLGLTEATTTLLSVLIGAITLAGSVVAFLKLQGLIPGRPILLRGRNVLHGAVVVALLVLGWLAAFGLTEPLAMGGATWGFAAAASLLGVLFVIPVGGADMPVVISLLNSLSGLAAAMTGFVLSSPLLVVVGSLVGASGLVLTRIMSKAMNRSIANILLGGVAKGSKKKDAAAAPAMSGPSDAAASAVEDAPKAEPVPRGDGGGLPLAVQRLQEAKRVIVVPGYGMALARAQFDVVRLTNFLEGQGKDVRFAVHPVAGRMPGHMNVLLAEADVDYDKLIELDESNEAFPTTDVVLVIGACDVVNPAANDPEMDTPLSGMPILEASRASSVIVCNLNERPGYSGVENSLYDNPKTMLLFGDAKATIRNIRRELGDTEGLDVAEAAD